MWIWASWIKPNYAWKRVEQAERAANAFLYNYVNAIMKRPKPDCFATCCKVLCSMYPPYRVVMSAVALSTLLLNTACLFVREGLGASRLLSAAA